MLIPLAAVYRLVVHGRGEHAFQAAPIGKAATIAEFFAIAALVLRSYVAGIAGVVTPLAIVAGVLGLAAVVNYIARASHEALEDHGTRRV